MQRIIIPLFVVLTFTLSAHAESRYVTDQILVALRPAQDDTAPPLEHLATGMRVEVVEDLGTFLKIKSATGKIGFARSKYFISTPPTEAMAANTDLLAQLTATQKNNEELTAEVQRLKSAATTATQTLLPQEQEQRHSETVALREERDRLKKEVDRLKAAETNLSPATGQGTSQLQWFLAGAAILLVGWFAGKSSRPKRRF